MGESKHVLLYKFCFLIHFTLRKAFEVLTKFGRLKTVRSFMKNFAVVIFNLLARKNGRKSFYEYGVV